MKKIIILVVAMCLILTACGVKDNGTSGKKDESNTNVEVMAKVNELGGAATYEEIYDLLKAYHEDENKSTSAMGVETEEVVMEDSAAEAPESAVEGGSNHSETNVQTHGVDEGDIIKTDGEYIYYFDGSVLKIIQPKGAEAEIVSTTDMYVEDDERSLYYSEMYLSGDHLVFIGTEYDMKSYSDVSVASVYDISDPLNVKLVEEFGQSGYSSSTRMVGDVLYMITTYHVWDMEEDDPSTYIPEIRTLESESLVAVDCIHIPEEVKSTVWLTVAAYDVTDCITLSTISMLGRSDNIYMSTGNIYVADTEWVVEESDEYTVDQYKVVEYLDYAQTNIHKFAYSEGEITYECTGAVTGSLLNQFSMDEYDGNFRVVTTNNDYSYKVFKDEKYGFENYEYSDNSMDNGLYVLNDSLEVIGSVENLGEDERVYSVRFDGEIGYFVTFRETDPLFAVDLSTPESPEVLSALKINGFSEYLHKWGDDLLLGVGMEADDEGNVSSMKLSMFDVSDPTDVQETQKLVIPYNHSEGLYDHHAIFVDVERGLVGFGADEDYVLYQYGDDGFSQYAVAAGSNYGYGTRGVRIGEYLYIVGVDDISVLDLTR